MKSQNGAEVTLRPLQISDAKILAHLANNVNISKFLRDSFPSPYTVNDAMEFIPFTLSKTPLENFAIIYQGDLAGVCGAHPYDDIHRYTAEIGYWLGEPYWAKGIMSQAIKILMTYCFEQVGYNRIEAITFDNNPASMRVLEKCGFKKEGIQYSHVYKNGLFYDAHLYGTVNSQFKTS